MSNVRDEIDETSALGLKIKLWVAILFMAAAFLGGFLVRGLAQPATATQTGSQLQLPLGQQQYAPALDPSQLSGALPSGHPSINGSGIGSPVVGTGTGSGNKSPGTQGK